MYTIDDLNVRLLSELKEIAEKMGVKNAKKLAKQELVYKILDQQALIDTPGSKEPHDSGEKKLRPRRRENVAPGGREPRQGAKPAPEPVAPAPAMETPGTVTRFEEPQQQRPPVPQQDGGQMT